MPTLSAAGHAIQSLSSGVCIFPRRAPTAAHGAGARGSTRSRAALVMTKARPGYATHTGPSADRDIPRGSTMSQNGINHPAFRRVVLPLNYTQTSPEPTPTQSCIVYNIPSSVLCPAARSFHADRRVCDRSMTESNNVSSERMEVRFPAGHLSHIRMDRQGQPTRQRHRSRTLSNGSDPARRDQRVINFSLRVNAARVDQPRPVEYSPSAPMITHRRAWIGQRSGLATSARG